MAGTFGNKNAIGNQGGRPRTWDRKFIALEMIAWSKLDTATNLNGFCGIHEIWPQKLYEWADDDIEFWEALTITKSNLAQRREDMLNQGLLHKAAYDNNAGAYDYVIKRNKRKDMEFESKLKHAELAKVDANIVLSHEKVLDQLSAMVSGNKSSRNNSASSSENKTIKVEMSADKSA